MIDAHAATIVGVRPPGMAFERGQNPGQPQRCRYSSPTAPLYDVRARDPFTFLAVRLVLFATALAASWIPVRRAMRIEPAIVLRE